MSSTLIENLRKPRKQYSIDYILALKESSTSKPFSKETNQFLDKSFGKPIDFHPSIAFRRFNPSSSIEVDLLDAIENNDPDKVSKCIEKGAKDWNSALRVCGLSGNTMFIQTLLDRGADDIEGCLACGAISGNVSVLEQMISLGAKDLDTALLCAAERGNVLCLEFLLKRKVAKLNEALVIAIKNSRLQCIPYLVKHGANNWQEAVDASPKGRRLQVIRALVQMRRKST